MKIKNINGWTIKVKGNTGLITDEVKKELEKYNGGIYWNDVECKYWMFDIEIGGIWFENAIVNYENSTITLEVFGEAIPQF